MCVCVCVVVEEKKTGMGAQGNEHGKTVVLCVGVLCGAEPKAKGVCVWWVKCVESVS